MPLSILLITSNSCTRIGVLTEFFHDAYINTAGFLYSSPFPTQHPSFALLNNHRLWPQNFRFLLEGATIPLFSKVALLLYSFPFHLAFERGREKLTHGKSNLAFGVVLFFSFGLLFLGAIPVVTVVSEQGALFFYSLLLASLSSFSLLSLLSLSSSYNLTLFFKKKMARQKAWRGSSGISSWLINIVMIGYLACFLFSLVAIR